MLTPEDDRPVLASLLAQTDLGKSEWYEVVYYSDGKWQSYADSDTFNDGEKVTDWVYPDEVFGH